MNLTKRVYAEFLDRKFRILYSKSLLPEGLAQTYITYRNKRKNPMGFGNWLYLKYRGTFSSLYDRDRLSWERYKSKLKSEETEGF